MSSSRSENTLSSTSSAFNEAARRQKAKQRQESWLALEGWLAKENDNYSKMLGNDWVTIFDKSGTWKYVFNNEFSQGLTNTNLARAAFVAKYQARITADL